MIRRMRLLVMVVALMAVMMTVTAGTASAHTFTGGPEAHDDSLVHAHSEGIGFEGLSRHDSDGRVTP